MRRRRGGLVWPALALVLAIGGSWALSGNAPDAADRAIPEAGLALREFLAADDAGSGSAAPAFPLRVAPGERYLEDADGKPFLIQGDTAWALMAELTREEVDLYLEDRKKRRFNTILVSLIEHEFSSNAPANAYGEDPFVEDDYTRPNEAYFAHADWVLKRAAEEGFLILLTVSYLGSGGSGQGWYKTMLANGEDRLRDYGEFVGRRYRDVDSILWVHAGDYNPPNKDVVRAVAEGIAETDPGALHTAHGGRETSALDFWRGEPWLNVNNIYTAHSKKWDGLPPYLSAQKAYDEPEKLPFFLIEGVYENEHDSDARLMRMQAYYALLSGAAGQVYGNNPIWHLGSKGLYDAPVGWREALDSPSARSMTHLYDLMTALPWWELRPDRENRLLLDGLGPKEDRALAAMTADRSLALLYAPSRRSLTVDAGRFAGSTIEALWYDPADGTTFAVDGAPFETEGEVRLDTPGDNAGGFEDWVLILKGEGRSDMSALVE